MRMSDEEAHQTFQHIRFALNGGEPFCPHCGNLKVYTLAETPVRWKCSGCRRKFSVSSGSLFHSRKLPIRDYLAVIAFFVNGLKGVAALHMAREMVINPKSAFVLLHKLREAMGAEVHAVEEIGGPGKQVEIDGAYFGDKQRPPNRKADRKDRRRHGKRQTVAVARERRGMVIPWVVGSEAEGVPMIREHVATGSTVHADEAPAWNILRSAFDMRRVNHKVEFLSEEGGCTNQAESYYARLRRSERGIHHRMSGRRLQAYADEMAWRENRRREPNGTQWAAITSTALAHPKSVIWTNYWHRRAA
jgi:transposase-like protein